MTLTLTPPRPEHVPEISRIIHGAFASFQQKHGFEPDFPSVDVAAGFAQMLIGAPQFYGITAIEDDRLVGSNFLWFFGDVAAVGPITVDPNAQSRGIGRKLMQAVINEAARRGVERVRLVQDAHNMASLSLYTSLGFNWRMHLGLLRIAPAQHTDPSIRLATDADLPAIAELGKRLYRSDRSEELVFWTKAGFPLLVLERNGAITAYFMPFMLGHGVADSQDDLFALITQAPRYLPADQATCFCPLVQSALLRKLLATGSRLIKTMNLMSIGPFEPPAAAWTPSIGF
jgi:GNAT superfamily N-acetyltransferase